MTLEAFTMTNADTYLPMASHLNSKSNTTESFSNTTINKTCTGETHRKGKDVRVHGMEAYGG
jgi:hypothetical protein